MPKTNDATGATYDGYEGVVEHAGGAGSTRPGGLSQLDPSRDLDGSVVEGFESEERDLDDRDGAVQADVTEVRPADQEQRSQEERDAAGQGAGSEGEERTASRQEPEGKAVTAPTATQRARAKK